MLKFEISKNNKINSKFRNFSPTKERKKFNSINRILFNLYHNLTTESNNSSDTTLEFEISRKKKKRRNVSYNPTRNLKIPHHRIKKKSLQHPSRIDRSDSWSISNPENGKLKLENASLKINEDPFAEKRRRRRRDAIQFYATRQWREGSRNLWIIESLWIRILCFAGQIKLGLLVAWNGAAPQGEGSGCNICAPPHVCTTSRKGGDHLEKLGISSHYIDRNDWFISCLSTLSSVCQLLFSFFLSFFLSPKISLV